MSGTEAMEVATQLSSEFNALGDRAILAIYHAQTEHTWMANVIEAVEVTLEKAGLHVAVSRPPASASST